MKQQVLFTFTFLLLSLHCINIVAQSPAAAPAKTPPAATTPPPKAATAKPPIAATAKPPTATTAKPPAAASTKTPPAAAQPPTMVPVQNTKGPLDVVKVLQKAGHFTFFVRLIKTTQEDIQLFSQLNNSMDGVTVFAPTDGAFQSIIKSGTLNSLNDQEKIELVQFHVIPRFLSLANFQTISNPLKTLAGASNRLNLNVTTSDSFVNITSGLTNTTVSGIVYTDNQAAIYQVDKVLLPLDLFAPKPPSPAPIAPAPPAKPTKEEGAETPEVPKDISGAKSVVHNGLVMIAISTIAAAMLYL